tara:strand:- start:3116 stop:3727 length:612 start_codon:yes stop_codon:yes gene_type:complete
MSNVVIPSVSAGDDITITDPNTAQTNWITQSTAINAENISEGGIDRRNITVGAVIGQPTSGQLYTSSSSSTASYSSLAQVVIGGNNVEIGDFTYNSSGTSKLEVVCSFQYGGAANSGSENRFAVQLYYTTGGSATALASTHRRVSYGANLLPIKGSMTIRHLFAASTGSVSNLKFHLYAGELVSGGANLTIENVAFYARLYHC